MSSWARATEGLASGVERAVAADDAWFLLTAIGIGERSFVEAAAEIAQVAAYEGSLKDVRVLDLGCGVGRHMVAAANLGAQVHGIDASPLLIEIAHEVIPHASLGVGDFHSPDVSGDHDIVLLMSDTLSLATTPAGVAAVLRAARAGARDDGLIVVVIAAPEVSAGRREWKRRLGIDTVESVTSVVVGDGTTSVRRAFEFHVGERTNRFSASSLECSVDQLKALARSASLRLEEALPTGSDGDTMLFFRAASGLDYLSDQNDLLRATESRSV